MKNASHTTITVFGSLMGLAGIEHGIGELLQGSQVPTGIFIQSWPGSPFFSLMNGEPAMTILPNLMVTGILAIGFSLAYLLWAVLFMDRKNSGWMLAALSIPMLLFGAGLFPPILGLLLGAAYISGTGRPAWWAKTIPVKSQHTLGRIWPAMMVIAVSIWLLMVPGLNILDYFFGLRGLAETLLMAVLPLALVSLMVTVISGFFYDLGDAVAPSSAKILTSAMRSG